MISPSDGRIMVCMVLNHYVLCNVIILLQITNEMMSSTLYIMGNETDAMLDSGMYICQINLTIAETDEFTDMSDPSAVVIQGKVTLSKHVSDL